MENGEEDGPSADDQFNVPGGAWVPDAECGLQLREYVEMPLSRLFGHFATVNWRVVDMICALFSTPIRFVTSLAVTYKQLDVGSDVCLSHCPWSSIIPVVFN